MRRAHFIETAMFFAVFSFFAFAIFPRANFAFDTFAAQQVASTAEMGATIAPNPTNTLAMQLRDWQESLDARQAEVQKREQEVRDANRLDMEKEQRILLGVILFFLVVLITTNTYTHHRDLAHERYSLAHERLILAHGGVQTSGTLDFHVPRARSNTLDLRTNKHVT